MNSFCGRRQISWRSSTRWSLPITAGTTASPYPLPPRSSAISDRIARYLNDFAESGVPFRARICEATNMQVIEDVAAGNADIGILKPNYMTADYYLHTA